ncbi:MAG: TonB-dependent receptor domain-containing protein, partial [Sphingopyxis sp.]
RGNDQVLEAFGELEIPLLRNLPFAQDLTLNVSARATDYRSYGTDYTYKIGGIYTPVDWLSLRGTYGTSYRAPALFEQYLSPTSGFLSSNLDPCNNYGALDATSPRAVNCAAEGLSPNFQATSGVTVFQMGGAAAGLEAETSTNLTVGLVFQPELGTAFGDLSLAVDYYDIKVSNGEARAGASSILSLCYDDPQFRAGGSFCRLVTRAAGSNALTVNDSYINLSVDIVRGIDYTLRYARDIGTARLRINGVLNQYLEQSGKLFADDPLDDLNGTLNTPKFSGQIDGTVEWKSWQFRYGLEWVDGMDSTEYLGLDPATSTYIFKVDDYFTHSASVRWRGDDFGITMGVRNLTNRTPPQISAGAYSRVGNSPLYSGYDYVGRTFFINVSADF